MKSNAQLSPLGQDLALRFAASLHITNGDGVCWRMAVYSAKVLQVEVISHALRGNPVKASFLHQPPEILDRISIELGRTECSRILRFAFVHIQNERNLNGFAIKLLATLASAVLSISEAADVHFS